MSRKPEGVEVQVIHETITTTYPTPGKASHTAIVTYQASDPVPRTVFLPLSEVAPGRESELLAEISAKKGDLYSKYLEARAKRIREDHERAAGFKAEVVRI